MTDFKDYLALIYVGFECHLVKVIPETCRAH